MTDETPWRAYHISQVRKTCLLLSSPILTFSQYIPSTYELPGIVDTALNEKDKMPPLLGFTFYLSVIFISETVYKTHSTVSDRVSHQESG
jgi:hypothetical protein